MIFLMIGVSILITGNGDALPFIVSFIGIFGMFLLFCFMIVPHKVDREKQRRAKREHRVPAGRGAYDDGNMSACPDGAEGESDHG